MLYFVTLNTKQRRRLFFENHKLINCSLKLPLQWLMLIYCDKGSLGFILALLHNNKKMIKVRKKIIILTWTLWIVQKEMSHCID